jgi:hypothetical protein
MKAQYGIEQSCFQRDKNMYQKRKYRCTTAARSTETVFENARQLHEEASGFRGRRPAGE